MWPPGAYRLPELRDRLRYGELRDPHPAYAGYFKRDPTQAEVRADLAEIAARQEADRQVAAAAAAARAQEARVRPVRVAVFGPVQRALESKLADRGGVWVRNHSGRPIPVAAPARGATDWEVAGRDFYLKVAADEGGADCVWITRRQEGAGVFRSGPFRRSEASEEFMELLLPHMVDPPRRRRLKLFR